MENTIVALHDPKSNIHASLNTRSFSAEGAFAAIADDGREEGQDDEEEEAEDEEEEEEEEVGGGGGGIEEEGEHYEEEEEESYDHSLDEATEQVPNKKLGEPTCFSSGANSLLVGGCESQELPPVQRSVKRSRPSTAKERISKMPPCAAGKRSSIYRGVTRHRWTGRYEAHLWDKSTWNQTQNKKGKQVYLGAYDDEEAAARAYDLAALKYWGPGTVINFPVSDYARDIDEMQSVSREDYLASLRRKSSGFSRTLKGKGLGRSQPNARWDLQGGNFVSIPTISGYDSIRNGRGRPLEYGILGCPPTGMINLCHFLNWLQPLNLSSETHLDGSKKSFNFKYMDEDRLSEEHSSQRSSTCGEEYSDGTYEQDERYRGNKASQSYEPYQLPTLGLHNGESRSGISALTALSRSTLFARMEQDVTGAKGPEVAVESRVVSESAAAALAAALAMDDSAQLEETEKEKTCSLHHSSDFPEAHLSFLRVGALAASGQMDECMQSSQEVESTSCSMDPNNTPADDLYTSARAGQIISCTNNYSSGDYVNLHSLLGFPLPPPIPSVMDQQTAYLADHMPGVWSAFDPPSSMSMGMIF